MAFVAGLLSFLSPCVLPLVPGYLSFVSGLPAEELRQGATRAARRKVLVNALAFIGGFTAVFVALGASATAVGQVLSDHMPLLLRIGGIVVVLFGLHTMGVLKIRWLYQEKRMQLASKPIGLLGSGLVGVAFAFGWTPCIGPILGAILALASTEDTVWHGVLLLLIYSLGLGIPFLLMALAFNQVLSLTGRLRRHMRKVELASGALLVVVGLLIFTGKLAALTTAAQSLARFHG